MKIWTLAEARAKVFDEDDLNDESFITPAEMVGYFNEAIDDAEAEIMTLNQDYFLTNHYLPLVAATSVYELPKNIYANKIRGLVFNNGTLIYEIPRLRRRNVFTTISDISQFGSADEYRYFLTNAAPGQAQLELAPTSRDNIDYAAAYYPVTLWYIRNANRIPIVGEYCNVEVIPTSAVNTTTDVITTKAGTGTYGNLNRGTTGSYPGSITYVNGDTVKFKAAPGGTLPAPLVEGTAYYVISATATSIKLSLTSGGAAIDLTTVGTVWFSMEVEATSAIVNASLIDIPEFIGFILQYVKCKALTKEGDPRAVEEKLDLKEKREQMIATLAESVPDDNNEVEKDFSHYQEMS